MKDNKIQKSFILFSSIILLLSSLYCKKNEIPSTDMLTVQSVIGDVTIEFNNSSTMPVSGEKINENSIIKTGNLSILDIKYKDSGIIRVNQNTVINVASLINSGDKDETVLKLDKGKVFVTVSKLLQKSTLNVKTTTTVAAVRGTTFRVSSEDGNSRIDVLSGKIRVNPVKDDKVIETVETIVETNNAVEVKKEEVEDIILQKEKFEPAIIAKEQMEIIKAEAKYIKTDEVLNKETKKEIEEIGIVSKPVEDVKDEKIYEKEIIQQMKEVNVKEEQIKKAEPVKDKEKADAVNKQKEDELAKEQTRIRKEKQEKERIEKLQKEKLEQERITLEKKRQEEIKQKKQKQEEDRVKNIPNF